MQFLIQHLLEHSAQRLPDHIAFRFLDQQISYSGLNQRSAQLANVLHAHGVRRGDRVGIYLNKSLECAVAIYAILKAGATYVPLDPGSPVSRLAGIVQQCGIHCVISHPAKRQDACALSHQAGEALRTLIGLEEADDMPAQAVPWSDLDRASDSSPILNAITEHDLAYIMYTSGSTGAPKGMMHTHHSGLAYVRLAAHQYGVRQEDIFSNHSPLHFDMSTFDYFCSVMVGACTVIIPEAYTKLPASLSQLIEKERISIWYSVPYALIQLVERGALQDRDLSSLRVINFGGEPMPSKYLAALVQLFPQAAFSNVYGPAEVNQCTHYRVPPSWSEKAGPLPIGHVWDNSEGLVVDENDKPVEDGEAGELLIRSATMMRGYWNRPDLNQRAFYERAVSGDVSDRFYRTGDLVQTNSSGELLFLGRIDRQVKVRGFRVELDEIEASLVAHSSVEEAAVYAPRKPDGIRSILASVTLNKHLPDAADALRKHLAQRLPAYAMPESVQVLTQFPRTGSGKIDRKRLGEQALRQQPEELPGPA